MGASQVTPASPLGSACAPPTREDDGPTASPPEASPASSSPSSARPSRRGGGGIGQKRSTAAAGTSFRPLTRNTVRRNVEYKRSSSGSKAFDARPPGLSRHLDPAVNPADRIVVIGDLHGMAHKAKALWRQLHDVLTQSGLLSALVVFLGDYCDRGLHTRELLSWLVAVQKSRARRGGRTVCLIGNHEFCLLGFLGLLPRPAAEPGLFRQTWEQHDALRHSRPGERERWWGEGEADEILDEVHLQGRRWGGGCYERCYGSPATFASYGAEHGDRAGLLRAMPEDHIDFLQRCPWVHVEENRLVGRCVFVHAGLEADGTPDCEEQVRRLRERDASHPQPEPLFGREGVMHTPPQLARSGVTVVSGHHGRVVLKNFRIIVDSCCGDERNPLAAVVIPEMLLVCSTGKCEPGDPSRVFPGRPLRRSAGASPGAPVSRSPGATGDPVVHAAGSEGARFVMPRGDSAPLDI